MRQTPEHFIDALIEKPDATPQADVRLAKVEEMVSTMEQKITDQINKANNDLFDRLNKKADVENNPQMGAVSLDPDDNNPDETHVEDGNDNNNEGE